MMNKDKGRKEDGDKILNNYKKQIAEKQAREKATKGEQLMNTVTAKRKPGMSSFKRQDSDDFGVSNNNFNINNTESLEPEVLLQILNGKYQK